MVKIRDNKKQLAQKRKQIEETNENKIFPKNDNEIQEEYNILFISFDIVNSTQYKVHNEDSWVVTITKIFAQLKEQMGYLISDALLWRVIGDEIIFIVKITSMEILGKYVDTVFGIIQKLNLDIENMTSGKKFYDVETGVQGALWIAPITDETRVEKLDTPIHGNVFMKYTNEGNNQISTVYEFMGNDIDTGFRIKKYTQKGRLVISFELAYLLSQDTQCNSCLHIIAYKRLKGVWENKLYPIIWYHNDKTSQTGKFEDSFKFDEASENELVYEYYENKQGKNIAIDKKMFGNTFQTLSQINNERRYQKKIEAIIEIMSNNSITKISIESPGTIKLQLSAICFNDSENAIFIIKRNKSVEVNAGKWEFGHISAKGKMRNQECIESGYLEKYGLIIKVIMEEGRNDNQPRPLFLYQYEKAGDFNRGITVLAKVDNKKNQKYSITEYEDIRWITENEISNLKDEECVDDLKCSLKRAFDMIREIHSHE